MEATMQRLIKHACSNTSTEMTSKTIMYVYEASLHHDFKLYSRWGTPSSPGSPPGSKHPGLKGVL